MFKPQIRKCFVADDGEELVFWVREPSGREILRDADQLKHKKDRPALEGARETLSRYLVKEDGTALSKEEVDEMLDMRFAVVQQIVNQVQEKIGLKQLVDAKKD
jgi:F420-dependent methylenetetrahydromethanopterin dehydrogenase